VSVFGGAGTIPSFNADVVDSAVAAKLKVRDRKIENAPVVGGSFDMWHGLGCSRTSFGVRGEVAFEPAHAAAQMNPATGTFFGQPYNGALPVPRVDGSTTLFTGAVLLGWDSGRVMPYTGAGAGMVRAHAKQLSIADSDTAPSWAGIAGVAVRIGQRVSTFGEYRYTVVEPTIVLGTQTVVFRVKPSQVVAGLSVKL
jgi:opacity protein-like surface antigen